MPPHPSDGAYRLGDVVSGYYRRHARDENVTRSLCNSFPSSLACAYAASGRRDVASLVALVPRSTDPPEEDELVVHLRLGDVLDWPHYIRRRGCTAGTGCHYVRPLSFYSSFPLPRSVRSAVIVGDPWYRAVSAYGSNRSLSYRASVRDALLARGKKEGMRTVRLRPPAHPDADLAFLCDARHLLPGRGGFASLAAACARARGALLVGGGDKSEDAHDGRRLD